jgi:NADH-quinone oxidoreductase subunit E
MAIDPDRLAPQVQRFEHGSRVPGWDEAVDLDKDPAPVPDAATTPVPQHLRDEIEVYMSRYPDRRSAAIPALWAAQREHGWLSPTAYEQVGAVMRLTPAYLSAVASFYDMFETRPKGRHTVYVCTNISCSLRGADHIYETMVAAAGHDPDFNVRSFECLGACDIAPMASVEGTYVGPLEEADCARIVEDLRAGRSPLPDKQLMNRPMSEDLPLQAAAGAGPRTGGDIAHGPTEAQDDVAGDKEI